uniref:N-acetyltransferase domain-containing protein n=1 Tax=Rhabditophanes sp. KR3021 TaxID=114890 RepID=A0AC35TVF4_9BILA
MLTAGDSDSLIVRKITFDDKNAVNKILEEHFFQIEPLNVATGASVADLFGITNGMTEDPFMMNNSVGAFTKEGEIVGLRLVGLFERSADKIETNNNEDASNDDSPAIKIMQVLGAGKIGIYNELPPNINTLLSTEISIVQKKYSRQGIASKLEVFGNDHIKANFPNVQGIIVEATSIANQKLMTKMGYKCFRKIMYEDFKVGLGPDGSDSVETYITLF